MSIKVLTVIGTRPEAIKMAPVINRLEQENGIDSVLCITAQHRDMLDQVLDLFQLTADYDLNMMKPNQTLGMITSSVLQGVEDVIQKETPDIVLVHGDTTTTFASSLAAFYHQCKVGHVEAGLRSGNKYSPYPEEINRVLAGRIADFHFSPTEKNKNNLIREGVDKDNIYVTGNTVIDALLDVSNKPFDFKNKVLQNIDFSQKIITITCHRRENLGENMESIFCAIKRIAQEFEDVVVVYPVHLNPKVKDTAVKILNGVDRVHLIKPLQYQEFVNLMAKSYLILTDSGGIQEEAPSLGKPILVARRETERPEAVEAGTASLVGVKESDIYQKMKNLITDKKSYDKMANAVNPYGDGHASARIVEIIRKSK